MHSARRAILLFALIALAFSAGCESLCDSVPEPKPTPARAQVIKTVTETTTSTTGPESR